MTSNQAIFIQSIADVQDALASAQKVYPKGGGSKSALAKVDARGQDVTLLEMGGLSGILIYQPDEYTFTAWAGTKVSEVEHALSEHGQYLPFEPLWPHQGATLGGTVASGLSGSGRYRYGGVRDFLIGTRFIDGQGDLILGGGKVVKNAAGFDSPKLLVGSLGRLGIMVELTFKVFPRPKVFRTLAIPCTNIEEAVERLGKLAVAPLDVDAVDVDVTQGNGPTLTIRVGGLDSTLASRLERIQSLVGNGTISQAQEEQSLWDNVRNFQWVPADAAIVKVPLAPSRLNELDQHLANTGSVRRYTSGGHLCWLAWRKSIHQLELLLEELSLSGLVIRWGKHDAEIQAESHNGLEGKETASIFLGKRQGTAFVQRIKTGVDPQDRFVHL
ncbi:MAG: FAD-binding protein [Chloroflexota bacterium]